MAAFSNQMRGVATDLTLKFGEPCVMSKVGAGTYDPNTGTTSATKTDYNTYAAPMASINVTFGTGGRNTNLTAFNSENVVVAWFGHEIDATWEYNGQNITDITSDRAQGDVIAYTFKVGEK